MNPEKGEFRKFFPGIKKQDNVPDEVLIDESIGFSIRVRKVSSREQFLRHSLEKCYDWTKLKQFILRDLKMFYESDSILNFYSFGYELTEKITNWLHTFNGWGLKFYLLEDVQVDALKFINLFLCLGLKEFKKLSELDPESSFKSFFDRFKESIFGNIAKSFEENFEN